MKVKIILSDAAPWSVELQSKITPSAIFAAYKILYPSFALRTPEDHVPFVVEKHRFVRPEDLLFLKDGKVISLQTCPASQLDEIEKSYYFTAFRIGSEREGRFVAVKRAEDSTISPEALMEAICSQHPDLAEALTSAPPSFIMNGKRFDAPVMPDPSKQESIVVSFGKKRASTHEHPVETAPLTPAIASAGAGDATPRTDTYTAAAGTGSWVARQSPKTHDKRPVPPF